ncbi:MAG TPA: hypothetical protein VEQ42_13515 [Pyrinomonadaceae bacterium]|nr:hypothetical protein [Pyrinomonadaceae bacterium]
MPFRSAPASVARILISETPPGEGDGDGEAFGLGDGEGDAFGDGEGEGEAFGEGEGLADGEGDGEGVACACAAVIPGAAQLDAAVTDAQT